MCDRGRLNSLSSSIHVAIRHFSLKQDKLHKVRQDTNLHESPWTSRRDELPSPQFAWDASTVANSSSSSSDGAKPATGKMRKVRRRWRCSPNLRPALSLLTCSDVCALLAWM